MSSSPSPTRREIVREVLIFQVKLWLEGFKDVVLVPLSLGAGGLDLVFRRRGERSALHAVMRAGDRFERWVDLYSPVAPAEPAEKPHAQPTAHGPGMRLLADEIKR